MAFNSDSIRASSHETMLTGPPPVAKDRLERVLLIECQDNLRFLTCERKTPAPIPSIRFGRQQSGCNGRGGRISPPQRGNGLGVTNLAAVYSGRARQLG